MSRYPALRALVTALSVSSNGIWNTRCASPAACRNWVLDELDSVQVSIQPPSTVLTGTAVDESALHGVFDRLHSADFAAAGISSASRPLGRHRTGRYLKAHRRRVHFTVDLIGPSTLVCMRMGYQIRLNGLTDHGAGMCRVPTHALADATQAFLTPDPGLAE